MDILVGTTKGLFVLEGWRRLAGPFCEGWPINHAVGKGEEIWAAGGSGWHGPGVRRPDVQRGLHADRHRDVL